MSRNNQNNKKLINPELLISDVVHVDIIIKDSCLKCNDDCDIISLFNMRKKFWEDNKIAISVYKSSRVNTLFILNTALTEEFDFTENTKRYFEILYLPGHDIILDVMAFYYNQIEPGENLNMMFG